MTVDLHRFDMTVALCSDCGYRRLVSTPTAEAFKSWHERNCLGHPPGFLERPRVRWRYGQGASV